jgi:hypothetical protein
MAEGERDKWVEKLSAKNKALAKKEAARKDIDETKDAERKAKEDAEFEANKERVLSSGTAAEIIKYRGRFTTQELETAKKRLDAENNIKRLAEAEAAELKNLEQAKIDEGIAKTKTAITKLNQGIEAAQGAAKAWNMFANTFNAFSGGDLPTISTEITKGSNKKNDGDGNKNDGSKKSDGGNNIYTDVDWVMKNLNSATDADVVNAKKRLNEIAGLRKAYEYEAEGRKKEAEAAKQAAEQEKRDKERAENEKKLAKEMKEREKKREKLREEAAKKVLETPDVNERLQKNLDELHKNAEDQRKTAEAIERMMNDENLRLLNMQYD